MNKKEMQRRIKELEQQARLDYIEEVEWTYILEMLDDEEYAELKNLYIILDNSMHTLMDNRGQNE